MTLLRLPKEFALLFLFLSLLAGSNSKPTSRPNENAERSVQAMAHTVRTTVTDTQTIDWIPIGYQGEIADPPPPLAPNPSRPRSELELAGAELGPPGTVPVSRSSINHGAKAHAKALSGRQPSRRQDSLNGTHWYVSSNQTVNNIGGSGVYSLFAPYTEKTSDFSLLQTAILKRNVTFTAFRGPAIPVTQTVEAGWIQWIDQVSSPHLFTYYTTNEYIQEIDNQGGWNTEHKGWVQVDTKIHPGSVFTTHSIIGGAQHNLKIEYNLHQGNWWLAVADRWIGYYPGSLFSNVSSDPPLTTLAGGSEEIRFYGEVLQTENEVSKTDMGSGNFAAKGYGQAAYILNMTYTTPRNVSKPFNGVFTDSDPTRYTHEAHLLSGTSKGSYAFIGGPGAGGVVGG